MSNLKRVIAIYIVTIDAEWGHEETKVFMSELEAFQYAYKYVTGEEIDEIDYDVLEDANDWGNDDYTAHVEMHTIALPFSSSEPEVESLRDAASLQIAEKAEEIEALKADLNNYKRWYAQSIVAMEKLREERDRFKRWYEQGVFYVDEETILNIDLYHPANECPQAIALLTDEILRDILVRVRRDDDLYGQFEHLLERHSSFCIPDALQRVFMAVSEMSVYGAIVLAELIEDVEVDETLPRIEKGTQVWLRISPLFDDWDFEFTPKYLDPDPDEVDLEELLKFRAWYSVELKSIAIPDGNSSDE